MLRTNEDGSWDEYSLNEAVRPLLRYGLLRRAAVGADQSALQQHSLVKWRLMRGLDALT